MVWRSRHNLHQPSTNHFDCIQGTVGKIVSGLGSFLSRPRKHISHATASRNSFGQPAVPDHHWLLYYHCLSRKIPLQLVIPRKRCWLSEISTFQLAVFMQLVKTFLYLIPGECVLRHPFPLSAELEWTIFLKQSHQRTAPWSTIQPQHQWILSWIALRFNKPTIFSICFSSSSSKLQVHRKLTSRILCVCR